MKKLIKYTFIGGLMAILDLFILVFLVEILEINYLISATIAFIITLNLGFFIQKSFTFKNKEKKHSKQLFLFFSFQIIGLLFNLILLFIFVDIFLQNYIIIAITNKFIIYIWNFYMNNKFTFEN